MIDMAWVFGGSEGFPAKSVLFVMVEVKEAFE